MTEVPAISVVMPVCDNGHEVAVTLPAILDQHLPDGLTHEVVAVDDGSGPETAAIVDAVTAPHLRVVRLPSNRGRAAARNAGIAAARGDWIVLLDSDMIVRPDFLAAHARILGQGADISLGRFVDTDSLAPAADRPMPPARPGPGYFTSANVALRRSLLDRLPAAADGPFDADTFTRYGWEDTDLERRLARLGPVRRKAPQAVSFHICPPFTPELLPALCEKEIDRARMARRFLAKHGSLSVRLAIQATPLHRVAWEIASLGGLLNQNSLRPLLAWLVRRGHRPLASVIARNTILNPTYVRHL